MILATTTTRRGFVDSSPLDGWVTGGRGDATSLMLGGRISPPAPESTRMNLHRREKNLLEEDSFLFYADSDFI